VASKYCSREVRFADAIDKKIVPVFLEPTKLSGGLHFILHATQQVKMQGHSGADIIAAIKRHMPTAYGTPVN
jgi:hypothetical protein